MASRQRRYRMRRKSFNWVVALVGIGLAGVVAVSAATALAARSAASSFELVVQGRAVDVILDGTFTSSAPFCESGTAAHAPHSGEYRELYTCSDGSGSLTFRFMPPGDSGEWTIVEGSGRYASLRGKGKYSVENLGLGDFATWEFRAKLQGVVDWGAEPDQPEDGDTVAPTNADTVAPTIAIASARAAKLRRPAGAYSIRVALALRDDVEGNTVAYMLRVTQTRAHRLIVLASKEGTTASGSVSTMLRVVPGKRVRTVQLRLSASDPVGNEMSIARSLKLPRS
jgi:hypothetical protein